MLGFTDNDIKKIREKAVLFPCIIEKIEKNYSHLQRELHIQKSGLATWGHYFLCPYDTVMLTFNYSDPKNYKCPVCGKIFNGEPYEGAWWRMVVGENAQACYELSVAYLATGNEKYSELPKKILLAYADNYENYQVHGDIPYNNPGRFASQVLCEAMLIDVLARGYAIIKDKFTEEEAMHIENDLLRPSAEHLRKYMTPQIHNHEVIICSAMGNIGLVMGDREICDFAVNGKYGLKYQLDHALLEDGAWFEMSLGYHFFALKAFIQFEAFARYTDFSLLKDEHYRALIHKMVEFAYAVKMPDNSLPKLNDGSTSYDKAAISCEYLYSYFMDDVTAKSLRLSAKKGGRFTIPYLLYGAELEAEEQAENQHGVYLPGCGSNLSVIKNGDSYFLLKASPYGGEHDHYDRLAVSFSPFGSGASADIGTASGYGAPLHYTYYKNTATHNTVAINGDNMPPAATVVLRSDINSDSDFYIKAETRWDKDFVMPDSFTIKQWVDESYEGAVMRRSVRLLGDTLIDIFEVSTDNELEKCWIWHVKGDAKQIPETITNIENPWHKNPMDIFHSTKSLSADGITKLNYGIKGGFLDVYAYGSGKEIILAKGPDNPSTTDISYLLERTFDKRTVFVNVIDAYRESSEIKNVFVDVKEGSVVVKIEKKDGSTLIHSEILE